MPVDVSLDEEIKTDVKQPSYYKVIFLNDDETPMEWVVNLLMSIFRHSEDKAWEKTQEIHTQGSAVVGVYTYEIAEQKTYESITASRNKGFPLKITFEEDN